MDESLKLDNAYAQCLRRAQAHYENFPVASRAMPLELRRHVAAVYAFARHADDLADEGDAPAELRLEALREWRMMLHGCTIGIVPHPVFVALGDTITRFDLQLELFDNLLDAFCQDVVTTMYETFEDLLRYCERSANPVGRIVLALHRTDNDITRRHSDALCTGLQLANFWQDVSVDRLKPRIYIPLDDLRAFGVSIEQIISGEDSREVQKCIAYQVERTRGYFLTSLELFRHVPWRLRIELRAIWSGGYRILDKIEKLEYTTLRTRPVLSTIDYMAIACHALLKGPSHE